ncbi:amino acid adenylation domain-containing protein [Nocardia brasiliensis]|uniref:amino acid adenylation domain-containing protein n=1 Tax=Nocardia brasiliensis TaxID=37326 RepID=UPI00245872A9|nr:amino acid adenylation domain-containing protein [Nocardia brasiliensis]
MTYIDLSEEPRRSSAPGSYRNLSICELFEDQAAAQPLSLAAQQGERTLTYAQLATQSGALAATLLAQGVQPGTRVGVCGSRSLEALVALLGILRAGCAYVPLDEDLPPARLRAMAEDAGLRAAVVLPGSVQRLRGLRVRIELDFVHRAEPNEPPRFDRPAPISRADCAYVVFTSGSSGRPKAVAIPHRGVVRLLTDPELAPPGPGDRVLHAYGLSSDASTIEIWSALATGACLVLADRPDLLMPTALETLCHSSGVTVAYLTTSVFHLVARTRPQALASLRFVSAGGEAMDPQLANAVLAACPSTTVVNFYGPTENSVVSTAHILRPLPADATYVPIGRPFAGTSCHVLLSDGSLAAPGQEGELYVGGDGLALGYLGDPRLTADRFVDVPAVGAQGLLYRTGDLVVQHADGLLEYRGRRDRQIKLRGARIELDEVETRLRAHPAVGEAVVQVESGTLTAYVTAIRAGHPLPLPELRRYCTEWLPPQASPALVAMNDLPVTSGGKIDRGRLEATTHTTTAVAESMQPDGLIDILAEVWSTVLHVRPAPQDNFFLLGGDSLLASEAVVRTLALLELDAAHGSALIRALIDDPTLANFATAIRTQQNGFVQDVAQEPVVDFERECELGFEIPAAIGPVPHSDNPKSVLLTGASGFVGAFLLHRLLHMTAARVYCPVRATGRAQAERRVQAALARYDLRLDNAAWHRVECFPADLREPGLGLSPEHHTELSSNLDLIVHNAAHVNFLYPYRALRSANVDGTREIVRLAAPRRVPVHFISSVAVVAGFGTAGVHDVSEDTPLDHADGLTMGYAETKWVAEGMLQNAARQGLPVAVYRPYEVTGDQIHGACNTETAICSLFKMIAETGVAPDIDLPMDFVPVDHLADAVVHIATHQTADGQVYHLTNPRPAMLADVLDRMREAGFALRLLPYSQWVGELVRHVAANPTVPTAPFVSLCVDRSHKADISVKEMYLKGTFPVLDRRNTDKALVDSGLRCPPVDSALIDRYLEHFFSTGYLTRPARRAAGLANVISTPTADPGSTDPPSVYTRLRAEQPVVEAQLPNGETAWLLSRYEDVRAAFADPKLARPLLSAWPPRSGAAAPPPCLPTFLEMTGEHHRRVRRAVLPLFGRRRLEAVAPRIEAMAHRLIDTMMAEGHSADLIASYTGLLPLKVLCETVGIPYEDRDRYVPHTLTLLGAAALPMERVLEALYALQDYSAQLLSRPRSEEDVLRILLSDSKLTRDDVVSFVVTMLMAGYKTNIQHAGHALFALLTHPEKMRRLRDAPEGIEAAVDELLRYVPLMNAINILVAKQDFVLHGTQICAGDAVVPVPASANRDPEAFVDPDRLDLTRTPNAHLAFGHGPHACLGGHLTRLQLGITVKVLLERLPGIELAVPAESIPWDESTPLRAPARLPVRW